MKDVFLFNTATRKKEKFVAIEPGKIKLYACGPTVYDFAHIGNLRTYVFEDILVRTLKYAGYEVVHVMNITDVGHLTSDADEGEDKMEKGSRREGKTAWQIAGYYTQAFFTDLKKLNILKPQIIPKATDHIAEMIVLIQKLEANGYTYKTEDGIYFDTKKFSHYADFARLDIEHLEAGIRTDMRDKKNPTDFALWKFSPANEKRQMEWESPWGRGFPGWHIECSAMSMKYLGETFDIHCGGKDHIPVHHTNEIAQSECATGKKFARYWMHGYFLNEDNAKIAKSAGKFLTLSVLQEKGFDSMDYRFLILQAHYRSDLNFSFDTLKSARAGLHGIYERLAEWGRPAVLPKNSAKMQSYHAQFETVLFDDLNTSSAMAVVFSVLHDQALSQEERIKLILDFDQVLGLKFNEAFDRKIDIPQDVQALIVERDLARKNKNWSRSDEIRKILENRGYRVDDTAQGTKVSSK